MFYKTSLVLGVTGYLKERHWTDRQGQNHRVNELVVTGITKHLPKGMGKTQAKPPVEAEPVAGAVEAEPPQLRHKGKPRKGIIRVGAAV